MPYQSNPPTRHERQLYAGMDQFLYNLKRLPRFEIRLGRLRKYGGNKFEQKGVDVLFAIDLVQLSVGKHIDKAIIVSGDSDFVPAVRIAKDNMVITELFYHPIEYSHDLYDVCDERQEMTQAFIDSVSF